jgi:hypothetical protein
MRESVRPLLTLQKIWAANMRALALDLTSSPLPAPILPAVVLLGHLIGLLLIARLAHWPLWSAPLLLAALSFPMLLRQRRWFVEALAPLLILYGAAALRLVTIYGLRSPVPAWLDYSWALAFSAAWAGLIWLRASRRLWLAWALAALGAAGLMFGLLQRQAPAGVTGSDPFAYAQMAIDLARHGTPRHAFPLAVVAASLGLPTLPTTHVGYVLPNPAGLAPTVWPPGFSVLLAAAYHLGGERALLTLNSWIGLAGLALTALLACLLAPRAQRAVGWAAACVAAVLLATSSEWLTRLVTPLADGAALVLTALGVVLVLLALRAHRPSVAFNALLGGLAGLALAAAYAVRYTQVLVGPGLLLAAWLSKMSRPRARLAFAAAFAGAAVAGALPDLVYRFNLYGTPFRFGTGELALFSASALPAALRQLAAEALDAREFGWLWPLPLLAAVYLWRRARAALAIIIAAYGPLLLFHVWYPFVRVRDVLSLFAPLVALSGLGLAALVAWLWPRLEAARPAVGLTARIALIAILFGFIAVRLPPVLAFDQGFFTFGYLLPQQRRSLETLKVLSEPQAIVACSLNSGAVELYGGRQTVRPGRALQPGASWTTEEWLTFAAAMHHSGRPLYLLMDSPEMEAPLAELRLHYTVERVAELELPVFYLGGGSDNLSVPLWRVLPF